MEHHPDGEPVYSGHLGFLVRQHPDSCCPRRDSRQLQPPNILWGLPAGGVLRIRVQDQSGISTRWPCWDNSSGRRVPIHQPRALHFIRYHLLYPCLSTWCWNLDFRPKFYVPRLPNRFFSIDFLRQQIRGITVTSGHQPRNSSSLHFPRVQ